MLILAYIARSDTIHAYMRSNVVVGGLDPEREKLGGGQVAQNELIVGPDAQSVAHGSGALAVEASGHATPELTTEARLERAAERLSLIAVPEDGETDETRLQVTAVLGELFDVDLEGMQFVEKDEAVGGMVGNMSLLIRGYSGDEKGVLMREFHAKIFRSLPPKHKNLVGIGDYDQKYGRVNQSAHLMRQLQYANMMTGKVGDREDLFCNAVEWATLLVDAMKDGLVAEREGRLQLTVPGIQLLKQHYAKTSR